MKKGFLATLLAALLAVVCVTPAFAGEISADEQVPFDAFCSVVDKYVGQANLDQNHAEQFKSAARSALNKVELSKTACDEFTAVVSQVDGILAGCKTRADLKSRQGAVLNAINAVADKYGMHVSVDNGLFAAITVATNGGGSTVVASSSKTVKQTGVDATQTAVVAAGAAAVLGIGFVLVRKNHLFE